MDQQTALVRRNQWVSIINASQARPKGTTVRQWLQDNSISYKSYYYWLRKFRREAFSRLENAGNFPNRNDNQLAEIKIPEDQHAVPLPVDFKADALIINGSCTIALSNDTSPALAALLLEGIRDAR